MTAERLNPADPLLEALRRAAKHFGPELAATAYDRGLAVTDKTTGQTKPIPITATPVVLPKAEVAAETVEELRRAGIRVLGAVLNRRRFYVPDWIYRRV